MTPAQASAWYQTTPPAERRPDLTEYPEADQVGPQHDAGSARDQREPVVPEAPLTVGEAVSFPVGGAAVMGVIERITDRCVVLNFGRKIADGPYRTVAADPQVQEAYLGVA